MANKTRDTKLTLSALIAKKAAKEAAQNFNEDIYIDSLEGEITLTHPGKKICYKAMDMIGESTEENLYANCFLIYHAVKLFQDPELHVAYEVKDPVDIVDKLLTVSEIGKVSSRVMELTGFANVNQADDEVKN